MRLSTILLFLTALFVAVGANPGFTINKRGELSRRVVRGRCIVFSSQLETMACSAASTLPAVAAPTYINPFSLDRPRRSKYH
jgi:hypothetical protein